MLVASCSAGGGSSNPAGDHKGSGGSGSGSIVVPEDALPDGECVRGGPNEDLDHDGYTPAQGDCDDCRSSINPGAYDYPGNGIDEDCDGTPDNEPSGCDVGFDIWALDPFDAARSLGLCRFTTADAVGKQRTWGVIDAAWVFADGTTESVQPNATGSSCVEEYGGEGVAPHPLSHAIVGKFGKWVVPRGGSSMVVLSSGIAREGVVGPSPKQAKMCTKSGTPKGFPASSTFACPGVNIYNTPEANDPMALELRIRVPWNAKSLSFDFNYFTYEYPDSRCSRYNDHFVALLFGGHPDIPGDKNVSFDSHGGHVSVNNSFLEVCNSCPQTAKELEQTGFEEHGATGWLRTTAKVLPGEEITLRFAIWDMGDEVLDSTVLIDNIQWEVEEGDIETVRPDDPK